MDLHYKQEVTVGALVLVGVALFLGGTMWLGGGSFSRKPTVGVSFTDAGTLKKGSPVKVSGVTLGKVADITFESYGHVVARLSLDDKVSPRKDASAQLATVGLVADAVIKFNPGSSPEPLPRDAVIPGTMERGLMDMGGEIGGKVQSVLSGLDSINFRELSTELARTLASFQRVAAAMGDTRSGPLSEVPKTMKGLQLVSARLDTVLTQAQLARAAHTADSLMATVTRLTIDAQATAKQLDQVLGKINRGEGSLGRLANDTAFYDNAQRLVKSLQEFVDDLKKHPGKIGITVKVF